MQRGGSGRSAGNRTSVGVNRRGTGGSRQRAEITLPRVRLIPRDDGPSRGAWAGARRRPIARFHAMRGRMSSPLGVPDDRRERNRRPSIPTRLPVEAAQSSPPSLFCEKK